MNTSVVHEAPFQWLQALEKNVKQHAQGLPRQEIVQQIWHGIAFRMGKIYLLSALNEIQEVLVCPSILAKVPGAKPWVRGIANVRGQLRPVIDLQACLGGHPTLVEGQTRLLIINQGGVSSGVLVDEVLGIKHFPEEQNSTLDNSVQLPDMTAQFVRSTFHDDNNTWFVFDLLALNKSRLFLDAAL